MHTHMMKFVCPIDDCMLIITTIMTIIFTTIIIMTTTTTTVLSDKNQSSSSSNNELKQCKTINLIQRGEFQKALDSIGNNNLSLKTSLQKIYCLYRLNRSEEALKEISNLEQSNNKNHLSDHTLLLHLKAQIVSIH